MSVRATVVASLVLALAGMGDALLYVALPLHAGTFGLSMGWVAVLLSVNRMIRLFAYPWLARIAVVAGLRRLTIGLAAAGVISTLAFAAGSGGWTLLPARMMWGVAFGGLSLSALAYATASNAGVGVRVGVSYALRELGPLVSLTAGAALLPLAGVRSTFAIVGGASMLAIPLAMLLPEHIVEPPPRSPLGKRERLGGVGRPEVLASAIGLVADGMFPVTIALLLAQSTGVGEAAIGAGILIAMKRAAAIVLGPIGGSAAGRFGNEAATAAAVIAAALGAFLMGWGSIVAGAVLLICGAAVATTTIPLAVMSRDEHLRLSALARMGIARDGGAAAGPVIAMALLSIAGEAVLFGTAGILLLATVILGQRWTRWTEWLGRSERANGAVAPVKRGWTNSELARKSRARTPSRSRAREGVRVDFSRLN